MMLSFEGWTHWDFITDILWRDMLADYAAVGKTLNVEVK